MLVLIVQYEIILLLYTDRSDPGKQKINKIILQCLKVHKIEIFFGFDFEICIVSLLVMSKY
jgi:hypothetical protein